MRTTLLTTDKTHAAYASRSFLVSFGMACTLGAASLFLSRGVLNSYHVADDIFAVTTSWCALIVLASSMYIATLCLCVLVLHAWKLATSGCTPSTATANPPPDFLLPEPPDASQVTEIAKRTRLWHRVPRLLFPVVSATFIVFLAWFWGIWPDAVPQSSTGLRAAFTLIALLCAVASAMALSVPTNGARNTRADAEPSGAE